MASPEYIPDADSNRLPRLTKISAWWILTAGIIGTICSIACPFILFAIGWDWDMRTALVSWSIWITLPPIYIFSTIAGAILFTKKGWAWIVSVVMLSIVILCPILLSLASMRLSGYVYIPFIPLLIPFILLLLDQKHFWAMIEKTKTLHSGPGEE